MTVDELLRLTFVIHRTLNFLCFNFRLMKENDTFKQSMKNEITVTKRRALTENETERRER